MSVKVEVGDFIEVSTRGELLCCAVLSVSQLSYPRPRKEVRPVYEEPSGGVGQPFHTCARSKDRFHPPMPV